MPRQTIRSIKSMPMPKRGWYELWRDQAQGVLAPRYALDWERCLLIRQRSKIPGGKATYEIASVAPADFDMFDPANDRLPKIRSKWYPVEDV